MEVTIYNKEGKETGKAKLPKEIFDVAVNFDLLNQVIISQRSNRRIAIAHTKTREFVSGGGRKPWRQKGTGRARVGSTRNPIWRKGGIAFGPTKDRNFSKKINDKMRIKSLFMVLSQKLKDKEIFILDNLESKDKEIKTSFINNLINAFRKKTEKTLIILAENDKFVVRAVRNIKGTGVMEARNLNALDLLSFKNLIMPEKSIDVIKRSFFNTKEDSVEVKTEKDN